MKKYRITVAFALFAICLPGAYAWDGAVAGVISGIDMQGGTGTSANYDFRVTLAGGPVMCTGGAGWAYLNSGDYNYQALVAALMTAKAMNSQITIWTIKDPNNYCHIGYVSIQ